MINIDDIANENNKEHNEKWSYIPHHPYKIMITGDSRWGKTCLYYPILFFYSKRCKIKFNTLFDYEN